MQNISKLKPADYPGAFGSWTAFVRPKTWGVACAPVIAALSAVYCETHAVNVPVAFFTLALAVLLQAVSNMENDLGYTKRRAEKGNRRGLPRSTAKGWISIRQAEAAIIIAIFLVLADTFVLIYFSDWIFLLVGIVSVIAAYCYMGGPKPIAYTPFGEITVLFFFGLVAVCGTHYLQLSSISLEAAVLGAAIGGLAASVLCVNNYRDRAHDESIGRRTLAVVLGAKNFVALVKALLILPYVLTALLVVLDVRHWPFLLVFCAVGDAFRLPKLMTQKEHEELNGVMFGCVRHEVKFSLLFSIGALIASFA